MRIKTFFTESYSELIHKVTWPSWSELQTSAIVVMIASLIIAIIIFFMDFSFENLMGLIYSMFY